MRSIRLLSFLGLSCLLALPVASRAGAPAPAAAATRTVKVDGSLGRSPPARSTRTTQTSRRSRSQLPDLAARGVNVLVLEVDYGFEFRSHPELRDRRRR